MVTTSPSAPAELVRQQVEKILASPKFANAGRLQGFLRYTTAKALAGEASDIKEYLIAIEVYGRTADYDPKIDSIVRVEAGRLRTRLHDYYAVAGRLDPVVIDYPKGTYAPLFHLRKAPEIEAIDTPTQTPVVTQARPAIRWFMVAAAVLLVLGAAGYYWKVPATSQPTISVVPFNNLTLDAKNDNFARGLAKDLELAMTQSGKLRVLSVVAANKPAADLTLEGSIRMEGPRVRVVVQVLNAHDGGYVWSRTFDRDLSEPEGVQAELAASLSSMVEALTRKHTHRTARAKAVELYRLARVGHSTRSDSFHFRGMITLQRLSLSELNKAFSLLEQSVSTDRTFAVGHATLASYYRVAAEYDARMLAKAGDTATKALDLEALRLEPMLPSSYRLSADALLLFGRPEGGLRKLERSRVVISERSVIETSYA